MAFVCFLYTNGKKCDKIDVIKKKMKKMSDIPMVFSV